MSTAAVVPTGDSAVTQRIPPNQSLYIQNLPEKLQKHDLKRNLYMLFSTYGPVIDIIAMKTAKMRGQAHVLFRDIQSATQAMRHCQGFDFFGREMVSYNVPWGTQHGQLSDDTNCFFVLKKISYAKSRSHTIAKLTGTFGQSTSASSKQIGGPQSSLPAPPGSTQPSNLPAPPMGLPPPPGFPSKPNGGLQAPTPTTGGAENAPSPSGTKRPREESDDEGGEAPMEEDSEGGEMEMSESDDD